MEISVKDLALAPEFPAAVVNAEGHDAVLDVMADWGRPIDRSQVTWSATALRIAKTDGSGSP